MFIPWLHTRFINTKFGPRLPPEEEKSLVFFVFVSFFTRSTIFAVCFSYDVNIHAKMRKLILHLKMVGLKKTPNFTTTSSFSKRQAGPYEFEYVSPGLPTIFFNKIQFLLVFGDILSKKHYFSNLSQFVYFVLFLNFLCSKRTKKFHTLILY